MNVNYMLVAAVLFSTSTSGYAAEPNPHHYNFHKDGYAQDTKHYGNDTTTLNVKIGTTPFGQRNLIFTQTDTSGGKMVNSCNASTMTFAPQLDSHVRTVPYRVNGKIVYMEEFCKSYKYSSKKYIAAYSRERRDQDYIINQFITSNTVKVENLSLNEFTLSARGFTKKWRQSNKKK